MRSVRNAINEAINKASVGVIVTLALGAIASAIPLYFARYRPLIWLALVIPLPIAFIVDARLRRRIVCPMCSADLRSLVRVGQFGHGYALSMRIAPEALECPRCCVHFDLTLAPERNREAKFSFALALRFFGATFILPLIASAAIIALLGEPLVRIHNNGTAPLTRVHLRGNAFDTAVGTIEPGRTREIVIRPEGGSGLAVDWTIYGNDYQKDLPVTLQRFGGACLDVEVSGEIVLVTASQRPCFGWKRLLGARR